MTFADNKVTLFLFSACPGNQTRVFCFIDPCWRARCPRNPSAVCIPDYCGTCKARFYNSTFHEVNYTGELIVCQHFIHRVASSSFRNMNNV